MKKPDLITVLGPTATGKTKLAVQLAAKLDGEIISADSRQVYRGMDIGTGKDLEEYDLNGKQIPYHLVDIADPGTEYNVYAFQEDFLNAYNAIRKRKKQPVLCGGTGLYLDSVLKGYRMVHVPENSVLRESLSGKPLDELVQLLQSFGPLHNTTDTTDRDRCIRAIEIREYEKEHPEKEPFPEIYSLNIGIKLERQEVRDRVTRRLKVRLENGMIEEIQGLLNAGLKPDQLRFYGLEYRFVTDYITGHISYDELFRQLNIAIHQFSKRQMTWFRRMEKQGIQIHWLDGLLSDEEKVRQCMQWIG